MEFELVKLDKTICVEGLYTYFYFEHDFNFRTSGERHNFWEMVYVDAGKISAIAENVGYIIESGNVIFHKPMEFHALASTDSMPHNILVITFETKSPAMKFFNNKVFDVSSEGKKLLASIVSELKAVFGDALENRHQIKNYTPEQKVAYQMAVSNIEKFLLMLIRSNTYNSRRDRQSADAKKNIENVFVESIADYLDNQIYSPLTLQDVCNHFNMSKSYLCKLFKNEMKMGIIDYYIDKKVSEAKMLIRKGDMNFTQISQKLCYNSIQHFTRTFKSRVGITPSEYEKSIKS